jgi:lipopolysaccharide export system permease protein
MTLSFYIARRFALSFLVVLAVFYGLILLIDMVEQLRRFGEAGVGLQQALGLAALKAPTTIHQILPLIMILATVALFLNMARTSELVVMRAAGRSALRLLVAPLITALLIGSLAVAVLNPIVAGTSRRYEAIANRYEQGGEHVLSVGAEGLWLRDGGGQEQTVIRGTRTNPDGTRLYDVSFVIFSAAGAPLTRIAAAEAVLTPGAWRLSDAKLWDLTAPNPELTAQLLPELLRPSTLTGDSIRNSFGAPSSIPIWELPDFIARLNDAGFSARKHRVWLQRELALPLMMAAMVLLGAGFTMRHTRLGQTGRMVMLAMLAGFGVYYLRNFAQLLGENGQISVVLAAWSPPVAALLLGFGLLLNLEDG